MAVVPGAFEAWTNRGEALLGPRPEDLDLLLGILGGSIVGKWTAALGLAVGINTPLFQVWTSRVLANPDWLGLFFGPIGATICAHFVMLVPASRRGHDRLVVLTVLAWFMVDSARTVAEGAWFNLLLINLPCLAMVGGAALWTRYRLFRDQS